MKREEVEALAQQRAKEHFESMQQAERASVERAAAATREMAFVTAREEAKTKHEDYAAVVEQSDLPTNPVMEEYIRRSGPVAGELMYQLGKNPDECRRIASLRTPAEVISAMTRMQIRLEGSSSSELKSAPVISRAPAPVEPVGGARAAVNVPLDRMSWDDFYRTRNEQERAANARM